MINNNTKTKKERLAIGRAFRNARERLGYKRSTFAVMLKFSAKSGKKRISLTEKGLKPVTPEMRESVTTWLKDGVPDHFPAPDLERARKAHMMKYTEFRRNQAKGA